MPTDLAWGILAPGRIARAFARGLAASTRGRLVAVGSRDLGRAQVFCAEFGGRPYGSYEGLLADPEVQAVYVAAPHHLHAEWTMKCAKAGKGILCEKPFTINLGEAEEAIEAVNKAGVFFMEAFMYRCHPQTIWTREVLESGRLGKIDMINAEFGFNARRDWDNFRLDGAVGGGAIMDVGCYPVSFCRMVAGQEPVRCDYAASITERGYDEVGAGVLSFPSGLKAHFGAAVHAQLRNEAWVYGSEMALRVGDPWKGERAMELYPPGDKEPLEIIDMSCSNAQLYANEADAVAEFFEARECPHMTIADTLGNMHALDTLRASAGLRFGCEE